MEDLHKSFNGRSVLNGIDLEVRQGEIVALVGESGSGKTVLLDLIVGQLTPDRGRVLVADHEQRGAPLRDLTALDEDAMDRIRVHWAIVFQRNALFSGTVYENIALWLREVKRLDEAEIERRAREAVEAVGLDPRDVLEKDRDELSGGMAKRVAVARAVAMQPIMMFYDEPTTGLDPESAGEIQNLICMTHQTEAEGGIPRTTLVITHDKDLLFRLEPRVVMLHEGGVHFDGPYARFREAPSPAIRPYFKLMPDLQRRELVG